MKEIVFVTGNMGKQQTAKDYFDKQGVVITCYNYEIVEPNINDIKVIAKEKVLSAYNKVNKPCISLECGFYVKNYPGNPNFPGAFPKRELLEKIGLDNFLEQMKNVKDPKKEVC